MENDIARVFRRTKKLLAEIARMQGMPMHYNSIMICINIESQLVGEKVPYKLNDLDDDKTFAFFERHTWKTLFYYAHNEKISKKTFAAFIASLEPNLVDTRETPVSFAEQLFSLYDVDVDD
jgi:hypothetical protein